MSPPPPAPTPCDSPAAVLDADVPTAAESDELLAPEFTLSGGVPPAPVAPPPVAPLELDSEVDVVALSPPAVAAVEVAATVDELE